MNSIALRIALHGLIALVPTTDNGANHMTALLVDARKPHDGMECSIDHHPKLTFLVAETRDCLQAGCKTSGKQCTCLEDALERKHVSLEFQPVPALAAQALSNALPANVLPENRDEAGSFSYVANLSQAPFGLTLNPDYLTPDPPQNLLARMTVPFETATACALATREDAGEANVHAMSFRELHAPSRKEDVSQALAQKVILELTVPDGGEVKLHISDFNGTSDRVIKLLAGSKGYRIDFSNHPNEPLDRDDPCNDGVARHFAMFYDLAQNSTTAKPLLPHVSFTRSRNEPNLRPQICDDPFFALMDRPVCPMARFNP